MATRTRGINDESILAGLIGFYLMREWDDLDVPELDKADAQIPEVIEALTDEFDRPPTEMNVVRFINDLNDTGRMKEIFAECS